MSCTNIFKEEHVLKCMERLFVCLFVLGLFFGNVSALDGAVVDEDVSLWDKIIFFIQNFRITGFAIDAGLSKGEVLSGDFVIGLDDDEFLPSDSLIVVRNNGSEYEFLLRDLISLEESEGGYFLNDFDLSGEGVGFGGDVVSPDVDFVLNVSREVFNESSNESYFFDEEVSGSVNVDEDFVLELGENDTVRLVSGDVGLNFSESMVVVSTNYTFREGIELLVDLRELNVSLAEGEVEVLLVVQGFEVLSEVGIVEDESVEFVASQGLEFEAMADGDVVIEFVDPSPANASHVYNSIYVNYTVTPSSTYSFIDFDDSLVAWYRLDNDSSVGEDDTLVYDWSGNGNNGTVSSFNVTYNSTGRFGGAYDFSEGNTGVINLGDDASMNMTESISIGIWFRAVSFNPVYANFLFSHGVPTSGAGFQIRFWSSGLMNFQIGNETSGGVMTVDSSSGAIEVGQWYHAVAIIDGDNDMGYLYLNGEEVGSVDVTGYKFDSSGDDWHIGLGRYSNFYPLNGSIDEVAVFNRSLSVEEVVALYNATNTYHNFVNQDVGNHSFQVFAVDDGGVLNFTEERVVEFSIDDVYPVFYDYSDDNNTVIDSGVGSFGVSVNDTNGTVLLEVNGNNVTATNVSNVYTANYTFSFGGNYSYKWHSFGSGMNGNHNVSGTRVYHVNSSSDIVAPNIVLILPADNALEQTNSTPDFSFNVTDDKAAELVCTLWIDDVAYGTNSSVVNAESTTITANVSVSNGIKDWWINCSDGNNSDVSEVRKYISMVANTSDLLFESAFEGSLSVWQTDTYNTWSIKGLDSETGDNWRDTLIAIDHVAEVPAYGDTVTHGQFGNWDSTWNEDVYADFEADPEGSGSQALHFIQPDTLHYSNMDCVAENDPYDCCTGVDEGSCNFTDGDCVGEGDPYGCCTSSGVGYCDTYNSGRLSLALFYEETGSKFEDGYVKYKMRFSEGFAALSDSSDGMDWFVLSELRGENSSDDPLWRALLSIHKENGVGEPLYWSAIKDDKVGASWTTSDGHGWSETNTDVEVPVGEWFTLEIYHKVGDSENGRFWAAVTPDGGAQQVIFNITNTMQNRDAVGTDWVHDWQCFKMYEQGWPIYYAAHTAGAPLEIWYDDFEYWGSLPSTAEGESYAIVSLNSPVNLTSTADTAVTFNCSVTSSSNLTNMTLYLNSTGSWGASETVEVGGTMNQTEFVKTLSAGSYIWSCLARDINNVATFATNNFTLTISSSDSSVDSSGGAGGVGVGSPTYIVGGLEEGAVRVFLAGYEMDFSVGGVSHNLRVDSVGEDSAVVTVSSEAQTRELGVGEEWKVDLDRDGVYDLLVRLDSVLLGKAEVFVLEISEEYEFEVVEGEGGVVETMSEVVKDIGESVKVNWEWVVGILVVLGLILGRILWEKFNKH